LSDKQSLSHPLQAFVEGQNAEGRTICLSLQLYHLSFIIYHLARLWRAQAFGVRKPLKMFSWFFFLMG